MSIAVWSAINSPGTKALETRRPCPLSVDSYRETQPQSPHGHRLINPHYLQMFPVAQVRPLDGGEVSDGGQLDRSLLVPVLRDHVLCIYHKQEAALSTIWHRPASSDNRDLLCAS